MVCPVRDGKSLSDVVIGYDDADVLVFQLCDYILNVLDGDWVNSGERLVKQYEFGVDGKCPGNLATASFATGQLYPQTLAYF